MTRDEVRKESARLLEAFFYVEGGDEWAALLALLQALASEPEAPAPGVDVASWAWAVGDEVEGFDQCGDRQRGRIWKLVQENAVAFLEGGGLVRPWPMLQTFRDGVKHGEERAIREAVDLHADAEVTEKFESRLRARLGRPKSKEE